MDQWAIVAGCLALTSVALSLYEITMHMCHFTKPYLQRYIIRILLMVPIYSLNAWFAMIVPLTGLYLDALREAYESFVIYSFMKYLFNFLNYDTNLQQYIDHKPGPRQIPPLCCLPTCIGGRPFLLRCKHGILQYVLIRPITTLIAFTSQQFGFYGEGNYNPLSGYTYPILLLVNNASQVLAMYCLVIFYTGYQHELRPMRPLAKFFSIKLVVFFSFFQSVLISGLLEIPMVKEMMESIFPELAGDKVSLGRKVQELLICFDMLAAAVGHLFAFTYKPFTEPNYSRSARLGGGGGSSGGSGSGRPSKSRTQSPISGAASNGVGDYPSEYNSSTPAFADQLQQQLVGRSSSDLLLGVADEPEDQLTCCSTLCSILDFSEEKSDFSEHFTQIYTKIRQLFSFRQSLPAIVTEEEEEEDEDEGGQPSPARQLSDDWLTSVGTDATSEPSNHTPPKSLEATKSKQGDHQVRDGHAEARRHIETQGQVPKRNYRSIRE